MARQVFGVTALTVQDLILIDEWTGEFIDWIERTEEPGREIKVECSKRGTFIDGVQYPVMLEIEGEKREDAAELICKRAVRHFKPRLLLKAESCPEGWAFYKVTLQWALA